MEAIVAILLVPTILFLVIVAPLWVILHYNAKRKIMQQLSDSEQSDLEALMQHTQAMVKRIETLEAILDAQSPKWRNRVEEEA